MGRSDWLIPFRKLCCYKFMLLIKVFRKPFIVKPRPIHVCQKTELKSRSTGPLKLPKITGLSCELINPQKVYTVFMFLFLMIKSLYSD